MTKKHEFIAKSELYEKMREKFEHAAQLIHSAIKQNRPIIIRHHADADGYTGAVAMERAIIELLKAHHKRESDIYYHYHRYPSRTPFYDYQDGTKDLTNFLTDFNRHEHKLPLVITMDFGSSADDTASLKLLKIYGIQIIVLDHHPVFEENRKYADLLINTLDFDPAYIASAGMLGVELAHILSGKAEGLAQIAAVAGISDKISGDILPQYIVLSKTPEEKLGKIASCLNFEAYALGYTESRYLIDDLLGKDQDIQEKLLALISPMIEAEVKEQMESIRKYVKVYDLPSYAVAVVHYDEISGDHIYSSHGKVVSLAIDYVKEKIPKPVLSIGFGEAMATFRISEPIDLSFQAIMKELKEKMPYAQIRGGGHRRAGSFSYVKAAKKEVIEKIMAIVGVKYYG